MNPEPLLDVAQLVADGEPFNLMQVSSSLSTDLEREIADELASVARIASAHRKLHHLLPSDSAASEGTRWGHLELLEVIGRGSYGTVYRAWDNRLERQVALKLFHGARDPNAVMREGRLLARIRHENVVTIYGADVYDGVAGIWMEFVRGRRLDQIVQQQGPLSAREATLIGVDIARALASVHAAGSVHCDVKAQNIVREPGGRLVLMDFGAGRAFASTAEADVLVQTAGTPLYMAPELFDHRAPTAQTDVYSVGVLLFYLVSGRFPAEGQTLSEVRAAHAGNRRLHLRDLRPDLPAAFLREVSRALDPDPSARHSTPGELEAALLAGSASPATQDIVAVKPTPVARRWMVLATAVLLLGIVGAVSSLIYRTPSTNAVAPVRSIAVLPIRNLTGDASKAYLADGLTEVLIANLARISSLRVPSFAAVSAYRENTVASPTIADRLGVDLVLAGSLIESGTRTRVTLQLVDAKAETVVWGDEVIRDSTTIFAAQAEIIRRITVLLGLRLSPEHQRSLMAQTIDRRAQESFLRGVAEAHTFLSSRAPIAAQHFRDALEIEPQFAAAWAELALVELGRIQLSPDWSDRRERGAEVKKLATRAIDIDPMFPTGYTALGAVQFNIDWDFVAAEASFRRALDLAPSDTPTRQRLSMLLAALGRLEEAFVVAEEARQIEPLVAARSSSLGILHYYARNYPRAAAEIQRALSLNPSFPPAHLALGRVYAAMNRFDEAIRSIERSMAQEPIGAYMVELARVHAQAGNRSELARTLEKATELRKSGEGFSLDNYAYIAAAEGRIDDAFNILDQAVEQRMTNLLWIAVDPRADPLRADPRFGPLLRRIGVSR